MGPDHAKRLLLLQALRDQLFVARLKDMERQGRSGKEHHIQREQGKEAHELIL
jgi:hypothetical protein